MIVYEKCDMPVHLQVIFTSTKLLGRAIFKCFYVEHVPHADRHAKKARGLDGHQIPF